MVSWYWPIVSFVVACLVWEYLGSTIKVWLHLEEKKIGTDIKSKL